MLYIQNTYIRLSGFGRKRNREIYRPESGDDI